MLARCRKLLALLTLFAGIFHASHVLAVGLGELTVNSSLNEPLDASIQLLGLDGLTNSQIQAGLGGLEDFERANIDRIGLIDGITLEIIISNSQEGILRLTSMDPVVEPFLSMVISVRWPNGRLMRDYTALIDLPNFISTEPQVVPVDIPQAPVPAREAEPAPEPTPEPQPQVLSNTVPETPVIEETSEDLIEDVEDVIEEIAEPASAPVAEEIAEIEDEIAVAAPAPELDAALVDEAPNESVTIASGNTLYDIAAQNRPGTSVTVEQTMLAIQRANPDAFIDNNINMIRVGQVLRMPSIQDVQSIDQSQALEQIALQNQAVSVQPLAFINNQGADDAQGVDELTILSGEDGTDSLSGDSDMAETIAALENQLAISEENLDRARLENQELMARFGELTEQIEILQNIIAMQDERLAQLQADLASRADEAPEDVTAQAQQTIADTPAQPPQTDTSLMGQLSSVFENTLVLVSSLVSLILLVVGFLVWRRRPVHDGIDGFDLEDVALQGGAEVYEPDGASAGFIAAKKAKLSRGNDEDDEPELTEKELAETEDDYEDDEEGGLISKLKGLFRRSSDEDEDYADDEFDDLDDEQDDEDLLDESNAISIDADDALAESDDVYPDDEDEQINDEDLDDLIVAEFAEESEADASEELEAESADSLLEKFIDESVDEPSDESNGEELSEIVFDDLDDLDSLDDSDVEPIEGATESEVDINTLDFSDLDLDAEAITAEPEEAIEDINESATGELEETDEVDFDLGDFVMDDINSTTSADSIESIKSIKSIDAETESTLAETPAQEVEAVEFDLNDASETETLSDDAEEESDVEVFDFSLDEAVSESTPVAGDDKTAEDRESFEFNVKDSTDTAEPEESNVEDADVETLDFNVSAVPSFEEKQDDEVQQSADDSAEELETFSFDTDASITAQEPVVEELDEEPAEEESLDSLTAALDKINAEESDIVILDNDATSDSDSIDDLDLGDIEIDDSVFIIDDEDEAVETGDEPISDSDESSTKLDLAVAYEAMGDKDGAKEILNEVVAEGNEEQVAEAKKLLEKWG